MASCALSNSGSMLWIDEDSEKITIVITDLFFDQMRENDSSSNIYKKSYIRNLILQKVGRGVRYRIYRIQNTFHRHKKMSSDVCKAVMERCVDRQYYDENCNKKYSVTLIQIWNLFALVNFIFEKSTLKKTGTIQF